MFSVWTNWSLNISLRWMQSSEGSFEHKITGNRIIIRAKLHDIATHSWKLKFVFCFFVLYFTDRLPESIPFCPLLANQAIHRLCQAKIRIHQPKCSISASMQLPLLTCFVHNVVPLTHFSSVRQFHAWNDQCLYSQAGLKLMLHIQLCVRNKNIFSHTKNVSLNFHTKQK